jgi:hypothetical protein
VIRQNQIDQQWSRSDPQAYRQPLAVELTAAARGAGLWPDQIRPQSALGAVGALYLQTLEEPDGDVGQAALEYIRQRLKNGNRAWAPHAEIALGLLVQGPNPNQRFDKLTGNPDLPPGTPAAPTVRKHVKEGALDKFADDLVVGVTELMEAASRHRPSPWRSFRIDELEGSARLGPERSILDVNISVRLTAVEADPAPTYLATAYYLSDRRDGVVTIEPTFGCTVVTERFESGVSHAELSLNRPLKVGTRHLLKYRLNVVTDVPIDPVIMQPAGAAIAKWRYAIEFCDDAIPTEYWTFSGLTTVEAHIRQERRSHEYHEHDRSRFVMLEFENLKSGFEYGIDWNW